jgi:hypothetical protein
MRLVSLNGDTVFNVQYKADICNPAIGSIIKGRVSNINKFGILAETQIRVMDEKLGAKTITVIESVITKQGVGISSSINLDRIAIDDVVDIEVLGKKFELNDKKICVIGKITENGKIVKRIKIEEVDNNSQAGEDDPEVISDTGDDDDEEDIEENDENIDNEELPELEIDDEIEGGSKVDEEDSLFDIEDDMYEGEESDLDLIEDDIDDASSI